MHKVEWNFTDCLIKSRSWYNILPPTKKNTPSSERISRLSSTSLAILRHADICWIFGGFFDSTSFATTDYIFFDGQAEAHTAFYNVLAAVAFAPLCLKVDSFISFHRLLTFAFVLKLTLRAVSFLVRVMLMVKMFRHDDGCNRYRKILNLFHVHVCTMYLAKITRPRTSTYKHVKIYYRMDTSRRRGRVTDARFTHVYVPFKTQRCAENWNEYVSTIDYINFLFYSQQNDL